MTKPVRSGTVGRRSIVNAMARGSVLLAMLVSLAGCGADAGQTFMVRFMPFSATPDAQGQPALRAAVAFANAHPLMPVSIDGFHYGQYPDETDTLREERVRDVVAMMVTGGVGRGRIDIAGKGLNYAQGTPLPALPPDTVKVAIGL